MEKPERDWITVQIGGLCSLSAGQARRHNRHRTEPPERQVNP